MTKLKEKEVLIRSHATCLGNVRKLILWGSKLTDISIVTQMVNLEVLNLSVNNISTLKPLSHCPRLKEVYIRKNQIASIEEISFLKNLPQLSILWLSDNPIADSENYRATVICNLPNLIKLDSIEVSEEEKGQSQKQGKIIECDEVLPDYEGLDLNHTLSMDSVLLQTKKNLQNRACKSDEKSPNTTTVDVDDINQRRLELGIKQLDIKESSVISETHNAKVNGYPSPSGQQTSNIGSKTSNQHSNTVNAIMLLLSDLEHDDLLAVHTYTQSLLQSCNETVPSRSLNLLED